MASISVPASNETESSSATTGRMIGMPAHVTLLIFAMLAPSSYVLFEPAVCDLMFLLAAPILLLTGHFVLPRPINPLMYAGGILFLVLNVISMGVALEFLVSLRYFAITVYLVLYGMLFASLVSKYGERAYRVINVSLQFAALLTSVIAILARFKLIPNYQTYMLTEFGYRIRSTFKDANVLGPFLVAACVLILADIVVRNRIKLWQVICLALYGSAILLTFSRGAYLAAVVSVGSLVAMFWLVPIYRRQTEKFVVRMIPVAFLVALVGLYVLQKTNLTDFFMNRFGYQPYDDIRFLNQQHILETVGKKPVGIGPGGWNLNHYLHDVHSLFLRTWVEHGTLALIGLCCFLLAWFTDTWRKIRQCGAHVHVYIASMAIVLGVMSNSFSIDTVHWRHLFLFLAIPVGMLSYETHRSTSDTDSANREQLAS